MHDIIKFPSNGSGRKADGSRTTNLRASAGLQTLCAVMKLAAADEQPVAFRNLIAATHAHARIQAGQLSQQTVRAFFACYSNMVLNLYTTRVTHGTCVNAQQQGVYVAVVRRTCNASAREREREHDRTHGRTCASVFGS